MFYDKLEEPNEEDVILTITEIDLSGKRLNRLPQWISKCKNLVKLKNWRNRTSGAIFHLPCWLHPQSTLKANKDSSP